MPQKKLKAQIKQGFQLSNDYRRWWESNPRALADLSHFECDLLRPLEYISLLADKLSLYIITKKQRKEKGKNRKT